MKDNLIFDIERDVSMEYFVYTLKQKPTIVHRYNITSNKLNKKMVDGKSYRLKLKIPKKKIVLDGFNEIPYDKAVLMYRPYFVEKHTLVVDDNSKFDVLHDKAYKELYDKFQIHEQINKLLMN